MTDSDFRFQHFKIRDCCVFFIQYTVIAMSFQVIGMKTLLPIAPNGRLISTISIGKTFEFQYLRPV